jgi:hypothetical protein
MPIEELKGNSTSAAPARGAPSRTKGIRRPSGDGGNRSEIPPEASGTTSANAPSPPIRAPTAVGEWARWIRITGPYVVRTEIARASPNVGRPNRTSSGRT